MTEHPEHDRDRITSLAAEIVSAYVANNPVPASELAHLIGDIHSSLTSLTTGQQETPPPQLTPAVPVKKSVHHDYITCLEDGKNFKSLKRHLGTRHGLSPEDYRQKWNLPATYPMVAPGYAAARSAMAKSIGLGQRKSAPTPAPKTRAKK